MEHLLMLLHALLPVLLELHFRTIAVEPSEFVGFKPPQMVRLLFHGNGPMKRCVVLLNTLDDDPPER